LHTKSLYTLIDQALNIRIWCRYTSSQRSELFLLGKGGSGFQALLDVWFKK